MICKINRGVVCCGSKASSWNRKLIRKIFLATKNRQEYDLVPITVKDGDFTS